MDRRQGRSPVTLLLLALFGLLPACAARAAADRPLGWDGDCPYTDGALVQHVVVVELSASERSPDLFGHRIDRIAQHARQAADCEARFLVLALEGGRAITVHDERFSTDLNTERARDNQVLASADEALSLIRSTLSDRVSEPAPAQSDPGAAFLALADLVARLDSDETITALVISDGVTMTPEVDLNRRLADDELADLAQQVAPAVDLGGRVAVDWPDIGRTADPASPPGDWLRQLTELWRRVCLDRNATTCTVTTI